MKRFFQFSLGLVFSASLLAQTRAVIGTGSASNDGTGDSVRTGFQKVNTNFSTLWNQAFTNAPTFDTNWFSQTGTKVSLLSGPKLTSDFAFDGRGTNAFGFANVATFIGSAVTESLSGSSSLSVSSPATSITGTGLLNIKTPGVVATTSTAGQVLTLLNATTGQTEFADAAGAGEYSVKAYGAIGNGTADDRNAIQAACNAAVSSGGGNVVFPPGNYRVVGGFPIIIGSRVNLIGKGGKIWVSLPTGYTNPLSWSSTESYTLTNQLTSSGTYISTNMATYAGYSNMPWNGKGIVFSGGSFSRIINLDIDGGWGTTGAPSGVVPITGVIPSSDGTYGSRQEPTFYQLFGGCSDTIFQNLNVSNVAGAAFTVGSRVKIVNCTVTEYGDHVAYYGQTSTEISIDNLNIVGTRSSVSTAQSGGYVFATERDAIKLRCVQRAAVRGCVANITAGQFITIEAVANAAGCTDLTDLVVSGNTFNGKIFSQIIASRTAGDTVAAGCILRNVDILGNTITTTSYVISSGFAQVATPNTGIACVGLRFSNNTVRYLPSSSGNAAFLICGNPDFSTPLSNFSFEGNSLDGVGTGNLYYNWFNLQGKISGVHIRGNQFTGNYNVIMSTITYGSGASCIPQPLTDLDISNNKGQNILAWFSDDIAFVGTWSSGTTYTYATVTFGDGFVRTRQSLVVYNSILYVANTGVASGGPAPDVNASWTVYSRPTSVVRVSNNAQVATVAYPSNLEAQYVLYLNGAIIPNIYSLQLNNNFKSTTTGAAVAYRLGPSGLTDTSVKKAIPEQQYATAAPGSGYYKAGDIVWNTAPSSGNPSFWMCSVSGSPGTWKPGPNIP